MKRRLFSLVIGSIVVVAGPRTVWAQRATLYQSTNVQPRVLEHNSWLYVEQPPVRELQVNDLVTIEVFYKSQSKNAGKINRITQSAIDARLRDWILFDGFGARVDPQTSGDPRARGSLDSQLRTNADVETTALTTFTIQATVVDIRPNGNLVVEAHNQIRDNDEIFEQSLSGVVRREDVSPANTVRSEKIAELMIHKREAGHIRDAYRRGWLLRMYDSFKPF